MPDRIDAKRLYLKRIGVDYAATLFKIISSENDRLKEHLPHLESINTEEAEKTWLAEMEKNWEDGTSFGYGIFAREYDFFLGHVAAIKVDWKHGGCELGYWVREAGEGKGYMTEAVKAIEQTLFQVGFHRIEIRVASNNNRSAEIPRRCGFQLEGRLRECIRQQDVYRDLSVFAKLSGQ